MGVLFENTGFLSCGVYNLTPKQAYVACQKGAVIIDVREEELSRFKMFGVPEVIYCPFSMLGETFEHLPKDKPMVFADAAGLHSKEAVLLLMEKGLVSSIANLAGGLVEWERDELPLVIDTSEKLSGSCMCQLRPRNKKS
ncbi:MAG: rhodanese-like domain-containing protein [Bacteroidota bacterium]